MIRLITFASIVFAVPAQADPFSISNSSSFGFGTSASEDSGASFIEELRLPGAFKAQSRAVELLGNEFSRAATQGLIDAQETPSQSSESDVSGTLGERANLSVVNGIDRDLAASPNIPPTATGAVCLSDRDVNVANWGDPTDRKQLGKLRTKAIAENGEITPRGALRLARFYIAMGFGSEAKALARDNEDLDDRDIIIALADIVDSGTSDAPILRGQIFCEGTVALWAALARPLSENDIPKSPNAILSAFAALPYHLRVHLGPHLAERFRTVGLKEEARNVLNTILRSGPKSVQSKLAKAKLELAGTQEDNARQELLEISNGTDLSAAKALLELIEDALRDERQPQEAWVADVPSLVRATEGTEVSSKLNLAGLRGLISLKRFDDVRLALFEEGAGLTDQSRSQLASSALIKAVEYASDEEFLRSIVGFKRFIDVNSLDPRDRFSVAERLSNLGLFRQAASYLPKEPETDRERRIASSVLANTGQTASAIDILEEQPEALLTELGALYVTEGDVERALTSFTNGGQNDVATRLAIQTGDWEWVAQNGAVVASEATQALQSTLEIDLSQPMNGALIKQAETRRIQAEKLLNALNAQE